MVALLVLEVANFWLFKAPPHKRARIHIGDCVHCNHGQGQLTQIKKPTGPTSWTEFDSLDEAIGAMKRLHYKDVRLCGTCLESKKAGGFIDDGG